LGPDGSKKLQVSGKRVKVLLHDGMAIEIKLDMDTLMAGRKQEQNNRIIFHVICIGMK
jgi:hypothetical protein